MSLPAGLTLAATVMGFTYFQNSQRKPNVSNNLNMRVHHIQARVFQTNHAAIARHSSITRSHQ